MKKYWIIFRLNDNGVYRDLIEAYTEDLAIEEFYNKVDKNRVTELFLGEM